MILRFENVSYRYPNANTWTLRKLNLTVHPGQRVLLAGASGSGKSTFCRSAIGLIPQFHAGELNGHIFVDGLDTRDHPVFRLFNHAGLVFQNPDAQLFNQTVEAELAYGLESLGLAPAEIEKRLVWASDLVGLAPLLSRPTHSLSGGEKQRVVLGAILALRPRLLLLDEPFTHLDPEGAEMLRTVLRTIQKEGVAIIVVEHRLHEVIADFDRLVVLCHGQIVADGPPRQVLNTDISQYELNLPPLVRLFRSMSWSGNPLSVDEALEALGSQQLPFSALLNLGLSGETSQPTDRKPIPLLTSLLKGEGYNDFPPLQVGTTRHRGEGEGAAVQSRDHHLGVSTGTMAPDGGGGVRRLMYPAATETQNRDSVVVMEGVWFSYNGSPVLRGINLSLRKGECVALVGRNGSGKTTLIKHLNGLLRPKKGTVAVFGQNTLRTPVAKLARHVGFAWQNPNDQLFQTTVREEVMTGPRALRAYDPDWCSLLFERFELGPLLERSPFLLSEGQKKRVSFAAALAVQPELVVLDEPTAGQDESFRRELGRLISELRAEGRTILLVTHDIEFAAENANRWVALAEGEIVADGSPDAVMADQTAMLKAGLRPTQRFQLIQAIKNLNWVSPLKSHP